MAKKAEQEGLPGIPQPVKRKTIAAMEEFGLTDDKLAAKITKPRGATGSPPGL